MTNLRKTHYNNPAAAAKQSKAKHSKKDCKYGHHRFSVSRHHLLLPLFLWKRNMCYFKVAHEQDV